MFLRLLALAIPLLAGACTSAARPEAMTPGHATLIHNVTVIDGSGAPPQPGQDVLILGERIASVGPEGHSRAPADAERIDGTGRYLIPGLIDSHVHLHTRQREPGVIEQVLGFALRGGVTTVRDMGGNGAALAPLADRARGPSMDSPEILLSTLVTGPTSEFWMTGDVGAYVAAGTPPGQSPWFRRLRGPEDVEAVIADARRFGARGIKVHSGLDAELLTLLAERSRRAGLALWSHSAIGPATPGEAVAAGVSTLSHADGLAYETTGLPAEASTGAARAQWTRRAMAATPVGRGSLDGLFAEMRTRGACLEPTLLVMGGGRPTPESRDFVTWFAAATARAHRLGVPICAGTDAIGGSTPNLPEELSLLVRLAGLTPLEAIRAATSNNAAALGLGDRGLVRAGLRADLVLLSADPSADIVNLRRVEAVFRAGRRIAPAPPRD